MLLSEAAERSHTSGQRLAWERARLGTRLIATHELVIEDRSGNDHAYLTYLIEPATSQSALRCLSAVLCGGLDLSAPALSLFPVLDGHFACSLA